MRLWSIHPSLLDQKGLVALWREALLARKVLLGKTKGYKHHPQLDRFRSYKEPIILLDTYLRHIFSAAYDRGYKFDRFKFGHATLGEEVVTVTRDQLRYEWMLFRDKIKTRDKELFEKYSSVLEPSCNPVFEVIEGKIEPWEKIK